MLYLVMDATSATTVERYDTMLSALGLSQATDLACLFERLGVKAVYSAPHRRALGTVAPFLLNRRRHGILVRVEAHYALTDAVYLPQNKPLLMDIAEAKSYGLNDHALWGVAPGPETSEEYQRRVIDWFTNDFMPKYMDAPLPTVIVADGMTIATVAYYLMRHKPYDRVAPLITALKPASVMEFQPEGLTLEYTRTL